MAETPLPDDDFPILTDVIVTDELGPLPNSGAVRLEPSLREPMPDPEEVARLAGAMLNERLPVLKEAIDRELAAWLASELPATVRTAVEGLQERIIESVRSDAMATLLPRIKAALDETQPSRDATQG